MNHGASDLRWHASLAPLLRDAGALAVQLRGAHEVQVKPDGTLVTNADVAVEAYLVAALRQALPGYAIRGEEGAAHAGDRGEVLIDPIDGTAAYIDGFAYWGPTFAIVEAGEVVAGGLYLPELNHLYWAERGAGAFRDGVRLAPADPALPPRQQVLMAPSRVHRFGRFDWPGKVRALGSTAAHLALVASGAAAAAVVVRWSPWDVAAGALLVTEAGRQLCTLDGRQLSSLQGHGGLPFAAGAPNPLDRVVRAWSARSAADDAARVPTR